MKPTDTSSHSTSMSSSSCSSKIPPHLAIDVLYADDSVVVINKPCHLRSVPGHANPPTLGKRKRPSDDIASTTSNAGGDTNSPSNRQTAQEAWMAAIQSFAEESDDETSEDGCASSADIEHQRVRSFLKKLSTFAKNGIPRKKKLFVKYANRNSQRLFDGGGTDTQNIDAIVDLAFERIKERQIPLLNLPEQTKDEESAEGQLKLLGYEDLRKAMPRADQEHNEDKTAGQLQHPKAIPKEFFSKIRVVHRLDMETSGLLVFARTEEAASKLCEAWRNRDSVKKYYLARCLRWPPFHDAQKEAGEINLPLAPSDERLKWKVVDENEDGAKPSKTVWSVYKYQKLDKESREEQVGTDEESASVVLELQPVTGRTHQLRIHCAAIGSGIEGDTLYGDNPIEWDGTAESAKHTLCLHAHRLTFPHPKTGEMMEFTSKAGWHTHHVHVP